MSWNVLQFLKAEALCLKTEVPYSMLLLPERKLGFFGNKAPHLQSLLSFSLLMEVLRLESKRLIPFKTVTKQLREWIIQFCLLNIIISFPWGYSKAAFFSVMEREPESPRGKVTSGTHEKLELESAISIAKLFWIPNACRCADERNWNEEATAPCVIWGFRKNSYLLSDFSLRNFSARLSNSQENAHIRDSSRNPMTLL